MARGTAGTGGDVSVGKVYDIASICHEANRQYCKTIGDFSQPTWEAAPEWQRQSAMEGVKALVEDPSLSPQDLHQKWCEAKLSGGWKYGQEKNADEKTHPCLVGYDQLPEEQRVKDYLFQAVVRAVAKLPPGYVHA